MLQLNWMILKRWMKLLRTCRTMERARNALLLKMECMRLAMTKRER